MQRKEASRAFAVGLLNSGKALERSEAAQRDGKVGSATWRDLLGMARIRSTGAVTTSADAAFRSHTHPADTDNVPEIAGKKRLRQLFLPSRYRATTAVAHPEHAIELALAPVSTKHQEHLNSIPVVTRSPAQPSSVGSGLSQWLVPPPPYCPSEGGSSSGLISPSAVSAPATASLNSSGHNQCPSEPRSTRAQLVRTIQQYEDDIDLLSSYASSSAERSGPAQISTVQVQVPPRAVRSSWLGGTYHGERERCIESRLNFNEEEMSLGAWRRG